MMRVVMRRLLVWLALPLAAGLLTFVLSGSPMLGCAVGMLVEAALWMWWAFADTFIEQEQPEA